MTWLVGLTLAHIFGAGTFKGFEIATVFNHERVSVVYNGIIHKFRQPVNSLCVILAKLCKTLIPYPADVCISATAHL